MKLRHFLVENFLYRKPKGKKILNKSHNINPRPKCHRTKCVQHKVLNMCSDFELNLIISNEIMTFFECHGNTLLKLLQHMAFTNTHQRRFKITPYNQKIIRNNILNELKS